MVDGEGTGSGYSRSDKLAIALACLAGVMAIVLFLVEKTPFWVVTLLLLMLALSIYPILHFAKSDRFRGALLILAVLGTAAFGWAVWPKTTPPQKPAAVEASQIPPQNTVTETNDTTDSVKVRVHHVPKDSVTATVKRKPQAGSRDAKEPSVVGKATAPPVTLQNSPGSAVSVNQQGGITAGTINLGPPPAPALQLKWKVSTNQSDDEKLYVYTVTVTDNVNFSPVAIGVLCDAPVNEIKVGNHNGMAASNMRTFSEGNMAFVYFEGTPLTPYDELYITLSANRKVSVLDVKPALIKGLNN